MLTMQKYKDIKKEYSIITNMIKKVQERLNHHGYKVVVDGQWGAETQKAIGEFQALEGLIRDYIVGDKTLIALNKDRPYKAPHFKDREFHCMCTGLYCDGLPSKGVSVALLMLLEKIRDRVNTLYPIGDGSERGIIINAGYRCERWNALVSGAKGSQHKTNPVKAADIRVNGVTPKQLGEICDDLNPRGGVGLGGANIVHVDVRGHRARWYYI